MLTCQCNIATAGNVLTHSMAIVETERTSVMIMMYALYLYFPGLSFRNIPTAIAKAIIVKKEEFLLYKGKRPAV